jgi:putative flippase GtrA
VADELRGWHRDPFHQHELRYFSLDGEPTRLVSDGGKTSHDPPWPAPLRSSHGLSLPERLARATAQARPVFATVPLSAPQEDRVLAASLTPARGAPIVTHVNSSPNSVEGSGEITTASSPTRGPESAGLPVDLKFLDTLLPNLSPKRKALLQRLVRYGSVSAISTLLGLALLGVLIGVFGYPAIWSNVAAIGIATIPSFELNRRWVWAHSLRSILRQAVPYFILSFMGLIVSTFAVHVASDATIHSTRLVHTAAAELANVAAYGSLWVVQFVLCDRILFRQPKTAEPPSGTNWVSEGHSSASTASAPSPEVVPA